jgi:RNA polymerase sigma factor (sigma-70 family)
MTAKLIPLRPPEGGAAAVRDEALVAACAAGDQAALGLLYDRHQAIVWRFAARLSGPRDADDVVQSTFLEAWRSAPRFQARSGVRTWLLGIAHNLLRRQRRDHVRQRAAFAVLEAAEPPPRSPEGAWQDRLLVERVEVALMALTPEQRAAFVLCDLEGLKGVEAARVLDVRPGTLWRRLFDARRALRRALEGDPR